MLGWLEKIHYQHISKNMKKIAFLIVICIGLYSCDEPQPNATPTCEIKEATIESYRLEKYHMNGHEYLGRLDWRNDDVLTHSGECTHPSHKMVRDTVYIHDTVYVEIKSKKIFK